MQAESCLLAKSLTVKCIQNKSTLYQESMCAMQKKIEKKKKRQLVEKEKYNVQSPKILLAELLVLSTRRPKTSLRLREAEHRWLRERHARFERASAGARFHRASLRS